MTTPTCQHRHCDRPASTSGPRHALCPDHWDAAKSKHVDRALRVEMQPGPSRLAGNLPSRARAAA